VYGLVGRRGDDADDDDECINDASETDKSCLHRSAAAHGVARRRSVCLCESCYRLVRQVFFLDAQPYRHCVYKFFFTLHYGFCSSVCPSVRQPVCPIRAPSFRAFRVSAPQVLFCYFSCSCPSSLNKTLASFRRHLKAFYFQSVYLAP